MSDVNSLAQGNGVFTGEKFTREDVKQSQALANKMIDLLNLRIPKIKEDGFYGKETQRAWRVIQERLKESGYYKGAIDGLHGPLTSDAVRLWHANKFLNQGITPSRNPAGPGGLRGQTSLTTTEYAISSAPRTGAQRDNTITSSNLTSEIIPIPQKAKLGFVHTITPNKVDLVKLTLTKDGDVITSRELLTAKNILYEKLKTADTDSRRNINSAIIFINKTLNSHPQATSFKVVKNGEDMGLMPLVVNHDRVDLRVKSQIVVIGAEVESVATAIQAKKTNPNLKVSIVVPCKFNPKKGAWEPNLGGLLSEKGSNMRFFDYPTGGSIPRELRQTIYDLVGLSPNNKNAIPEGLSNRLLAALRQNNIEIIPVKSLDTMSVKTVGRTIHSIAVEGTNGKLIEVRGQRFLDVDPESRLTEKVVGRPSVKTHRLGYGVVFTVKNMNTSDIERILNNIKKGHDFLEYVLNQHGFTLYSNYRHLKCYASDPNLGELVTCYLYAAKHVDLDLNKWNSQGWGGLRTIKLLYDVYTYCAWLKNKSNSDLGKIVTYRFLGGEANPDYRLTRRGFPVNCDGFNLAIHSNGITFNSLNYALPRMPLQYSHDLKQDDEYRFVRTDMAMLERFLRTVSGNRNLRVIIPSEFYVRSSGADFSNIMKEKFNDGTITDFPFYRIPSVLYTPPSNGKSPPELAYLNDRRASYLWSFNPSVTTREILYDVSGGKPGKVYWSLTPAHVEVKRWPNLWSISKNSFPPEVFGATRIVPNLMLAGMKAANSASQDV